MMKNLFLVPVLLIFTLLTWFANDIHAIYLPLIVNNVESTPSPTSTDASTTTATPTNTATSTSTLTATDTSTPTATPTSTATGTPTSTATPTSTDMPCIPNITITHVPTYGTSELLKGLASCVIPSDYKVAVYIFVQGWWNKPTHASPLTSIQNNGDWQTNVVTGGSDECATQIAAFLVPNGTDAPQMSGGQKLPESLYTNAKAYVSANRESQLRTLQFAGRTWRVKACEKPLGPDNNLFSDRPEDVWVDEQDQLHLRIASHSGKWYASEIIATDSLGHGTYTLTTASRVDLLDKNAVLGVFTWQDAVSEYNYREIDIEFSRWGQDSGPNAQFVVQPYFHAGNRHQFTMNLQSNNSTHGFAWHTNHVDFSSYQGGTATLGAPIDTWSYTGVDIPPSGQETLRINLWLLNHIPPSDGQEVEAIISSFSFAPSTLITESLPQATYRNITAMVEPQSGLPHDRLDASILDIAPQFAIMRSLPYTKTSAAAELNVERCQDEECRHQGDYGLKLSYNMPLGNFGSFNFDPHAFDASNATYIELWGKGAQGGERIEIVLWSNCDGSFPGRPDSALLSVSSNWQRLRIPLSDFQPFVTLSSLCRFSLGFNDAIHSGGTIFLDDISFVAANGNRLHLPFDEETNVTNIGLYITSLLGAQNMGWDDYNHIVALLSKVVASLEHLPKWHGFPQTHNHIISLTPSTGDRCISTVDMGNLAAGLIMLRQRIPELSSRADALLNAMQWDWLYDNSANFPYGCRYPDESASTFHYDWLAADSRLAHFIGIGSGKIISTSWSYLNRSHEDPRHVDPILWHFEPGWDGGGLFMAFLPALFIDESGSDLATSTHNFVQDQIGFAQQIGAPAWGWSATALPPYGEIYCGYGMLCDDFLVPHAAILAMEAISTTEWIDNLQAFEMLDARAPAHDGIHTFDYGFRASLNWKTNEVTPIYLVLDQNMAFLSLINALTDSYLRTLFCQDTITQSAIQLIPGYSNSCP